MKTHNATCIPCDNPLIALAPYVWKRTGTGNQARAEATMPGAYLKLDFTGSKAVRLLIDGVINAGCPAACLPLVEFSVDNGAFQAVHLSRTGEVYALELARDLDAAGQHYLEFHFRAAALDVDRWRLPTSHLQIAGVELDAGGRLISVPLRSKRAIAFGDSITEGVNVEGDGPFYANLLLNNARATWFPILCAALDCEYGQLGTGGQGLVTMTMQMPPLPQTWDHYDASTSRLMDGRLHPEPDYIFCEMGTNDFKDTAQQRRHLDITAALAGWLASVRQSCPDAKIFCIVPPLGCHASEVFAAVKSRTDAGDKNVHVIDTAPLKAGFKPGAGATTLAADGVHPSQYGNAMLGAFVAVETQKILDRSR